MRQEHRAGEKFFVDYSGQLVPIVDASTGEVRDAQLFVGVMGGSNQTYAEATWTRSLADWTGSHVRAFGFLGAVPHCIVPDNLLSGVTKTCRYEPNLNPTYAELADRYGTAIIPARVRHPKDKRSCPDCDNGKIYKNYDDESGVVCSRCPLAAFVGVSLSFVFSIYKNIRYSVFKTSASFLAVALPIVRLPDSISLI